MCKASWIVGYNMPGYLPDTEPDGCESYEDALRCLKGLMQLAWEVAEDTPEEGEVDSPADELREAIEDVENRIAAFSQNRPLPMHELNYYIDGWAYWLVRE